MSPKQKKIAAKAPPPNVFNEKDLAVLREEKAKGRGMGLQDESKKPGKIYKAKEGEFIKRRKALRGVNPFSKIKSGLDLPVISSVKPGSKIGKGKKTTLEQVRKEKGFKPGETPSQFNKRRMALEAGKKALKATRIGKIALGVGAAGVAAQQYLKSKMKKKDEPNKKMGGGMMKRYSKGGGSDMSKEPTSKMKTSEKVRTYALAQSMKDKDRLTERDIDMAKKAISRVKAKRAQQGFLRTDPMPKKMGGGMMQKPMGYNTGGYKSKEDRKKAEKNIKQARSKEGLRSFLSERKNPMRKERYMEGRKARHTEFKKKIGRTALDIASSLNPVTSIARGIGKVIGKGSKKRDFQKGDYGDISVKKNMGGMMMQRPMGYKSGKSIQVKCKIGRNKPTKIT